MNKGQSAINGQKIVDLALQQVGIIEKPTNRVKFNDWFYNKKDHEEKWCGTAVSWIYHFSGFSLGNIGYTRGFAGCATALKHFKAKGEIVTRDQVRPGDIFIVDWNGDNQPDHTGIVKDPKDLAMGGSFVTLEGNTSAAGSQSNGGEYMEKLRHFNSGKAVWYFIHPRVLDSHPKVVTQPK